jgi:hypothetical protein
MKKLLVTAIIVGVLGYFGAKFYVHHEVSSNLDMALTMVQPFADIQYDGVSSTMGGELSIDGVTARFGRFHDRLEIDSVSLVTPSFWHLLKLSDMGQQMGGPDAKIPDELGFALTGMRADVSDDFMKAIAKAAREEAPEVDEDDTAGQCVGKYGFSMGTLRRLGYNDLVISMSMGYRQKNGKMSVDMWVDVEDMYAMKIDMTLDGTMTPQSLASGTYKPRMLDGRLEYQDQSLIKKTRALCRRQGVSEDEVLAAELDSFQAAGMQNGIAFDEYVMIPYQKFLSGGSKFILTAAPNEPVNLSQIDLYKPTDVPALLNLSAEVR